MVRPRRRPIALALALALAGCLADAAEPQPAPLEVAVAGPAGAHAGDLVTFEASAAGVAAEEGLWLWDFGDGATAEGAGLTLVRHEYAEPGAFRVRVVVLDGNGRRGEAALAIGVDAVFAFEGTVTATAPAPVGGAPAAADFEARAGLDAADLRVALTRPTMLPADPTPASVVLRVLADGSEVARAEASVPAGGETVRLRVPGERVPGAFRVEVAPERGTVHFEAEVRLDYA